MESAFGSTTRVTPLAGTPGWYAGTIDEGWNLRPLPQGGVVTALAVRAMASTLDRAGQTLRTLHTAYVAPVAHGDVVVDVSTLRSGRSMSHLRAEVRNPAASHGHVTTAVFGSGRRGFDFVDLDPPRDFTPLAESRSYRDPPPPGVDPFPPMPFWDGRVEGRTGIGHAPWDEYEPDRAEHGAWYHLDELPLLDDGTLDPLALIVFADTMPGAIGEKVGRRTTGWFAPSVDLTFHLLDTWRAEWVFAHSRARFAGGGYASVDMALWDFGQAGTDPGRLVAYATQVCLFTFEE